VEAVMIKDILEYTGGELAAGSQDAEIGSISTDSRTIKEGQLFIALRGENFDGHEFIGDALAAGCGGFVASRDSRIPRRLSAGAAGIIVEDTTKALGDIAAGYRSRFNVRVVGVTGSNGKTTTKEMIARISSGRYGTLKSRGTFNNQVGLPLTLLELDGRHEVAVLEMGASRRGDIAYLAGIAVPSIGVITNVSPAHYGYFKSIEAVAATKEELLAALAGERMAVLNGDDELLAGAGKRHTGPKLFFGAGGRCDVRAEDVRVGPDGRPCFRIATRGGEPSQPILLGAVGRHNIFNALAAACVGLFLRLDLEDIAASLDGFGGLPMRMQRSVVAGVTIINDAYNANPASVEAALRTFASMDIHGKRFVLMGDMLELGEITQLAHRRAGMLAGELGMDGLVGVGRLVQDAVRGCREVSTACACTASSKEEAVDILAGKLEEGDALLIKGSRKNRLEECAELLGARLGGGPG